MLPAASVVESVPPTAPALSVRQLSGAARLTRAAPAEVCVHSWFVAVPGGWQLHMAADWGRGSEVAARSDRQCIMMRRTTHTNLGARAVWNVCAGVGRGTA